MKPLSVIVRLFLIPSVIFAQVLVAQAATADDFPQQGDHKVFLPILSLPRQNLNGAVESIDPVAPASAQTFFTPMDATPDPDGKQMYFTAKSSRGAGVFRVSVDGGAVVSITVGGPLTTPIGLAINPSGQMLYIADNSVVISGTQVAAAGANLAYPGGIYSVDVKAGIPKLVEGSGCTRPRGVTVVNENGVDMLYFTGIDPSDGVPAVMKLPAAGGALTMVEKGDLLVEPTGIALANDGTVYVSDQKAGGNGLGAVFRIKQGGLGIHSSHREIIATGIRMGSPAGLALTFDGSQVLVSALDESAGTSQVVTINTTTLAQGVVNTVIGVNRHSGGLHRAHNNNLMAWSDLGDGTVGQGTVYRVKLK